MNLDIAQRGPHPQGEEVEQQRYRCEVADLGGERTWLRLLWHHDRDAVAREEILIRPIELPSTIRLRLGGGRQALVLKVDIGEVCRRAQVEIGERTDLIAEAVRPALHPLGSEADSQSSHLATCEFGV